MLCHEISTSVVIRQAIIIIELKGLCHEIDFKNFNKTLQN